MFYVVVGLVVVGVVLSLLYYFGYIGSRTVEVKVDLPITPPLTPPATPPLTPITPVTPVTPPPAVSTGRKYNLKPNWDYPHNDLGYDPNAAYNTCAAACDKTPNCIAYTTQKETGKGCWYKSALVGGFGHGNRDTYLVEGRSFP